MINFSSLKRYLNDQDKSLQAWSGADELAVSHMLSLELRDKRVLIINDQFGALSFALEKFEITTLTDSFVASESIKMNANRANLLCDLDELDGIYDYVLIYLPKNLSYFADILLHLTHHMVKTSKIICTGMVKHISGGYFDFLNKFIGQTSTSLAVKKARLIYCDFEKLEQNNQYPKEISFDGFDHAFTNYSNVFSREKLDIGSRFFLEHIPRGVFENILDLGCANGLIGIKAKLLNSKSTIHFYDESFMAIKSAKINFSKYFDDEKAYFQWSNCYEGGEDGIMDLVLCNPPFHQNHIVGDFIAIQMFKDAKRSLRKGGILRIVGNSHLAYQVKLKKIFGNSKIIATNKKFMVIESYC